MAKQKYEKPLVYAQKKDSPNVKREYKKPFVKVYSDKKKYYKPKADIYQSKDLQKSQTQYRKGNRSYRPTPRFGGTVFGLVSLILVIGLLASVFISVQNNGRLKGEPFVYFSPSVYLNGISSDDVIVPAGDYTVRLERSYVPFLDDFFEPSYNGYLDVGSKTYKSKHRVGEYSLHEGTAEFEFEIDGRIYTSYSVPLQGPTLPGETLGYLYEVTLPAFVYKWNVQPDFSVVIRSWKDISSDGFYDSLANSLKITFSFVSDFFVYQANLLVALLPWNSVQSSDSVPEDGSKIDIPWRDDDMEIVTGVIMD